MTPTAFDRRHRWKVLGVGVAANASFAAAFSGIPATAVTMRDGFRLDNAGLGLAFGLFGLGIAVSELPWGVLTDRWGDRRVLLGGLGATGFALAAMAAIVTPAAGLPWLAAGLLLVGLLGGSVNGSSGRAVMAWFRDGERGLAMSIRQTAIPLGGGLGALALPGLAASAGFIAVFGGLALLCLATVAFAWAWLRDPPGAAAGAPAGRAPLADIMIWRVAVAIGVLCLPQLAVVTFGAVFLHDAGGAGVAAISVGLLAMQAGAGALRVWSGRWTDRHGNRRRYLRGSVLLSAALFAALALTAAVLPGAPLPLAAAMLASGVAVSSWHGVGYAELAILAGPQRAGTALGLANTCVFAAYIVAPMAVPPLLALGSWPAVWLAAAAAALLALPIFPAPRPAAVALARGV